MNNGTVLIYSVIYAQGALTNTLSQITVDDISCLVASSNSSTSSLPSGPYFMNAAGDVYEAWRLYSDTNGAFTESAIGNDDGSYSVLPAGILGQQKAIALPSLL